MEQKTNTGQVHKMLIRLSLLIPLIWLVACQPVLEIDLQSINCGTIDGLADHFSKNAELYGCMVFIYEKQTPEESYSYPISIKADGQIVFRGAEGDNTPVLPPQSKGQKVHTRLYLFQLSKQSDLAAVAQHRVSCLPMGTVSNNAKTPTYTCLSQEHKDCWMMLLLQPTFVNETYSVASFLEQVRLQSPPEGSQNCRVCTREICGDGIDNNCDKVVDDYDDATGQKCEK
ncbi:MAG: hypothetical protein CL920_11340 [Deltaproteobacteria bacterium]|nr:hypothetical protein [Deltaproteobacteria bacterium]|tara:strand:- start:2489 stop:3175 length:687 start_codon:yes stop_codon:yes gene_type:complete